MSKYKTFCKKCGQEITGGLVLSVGLDSYHLDCSPKTILETELQDFKDQLVKEIEELDLENPNRMIPPYLPKKVITNYDPYKCHDIGFVTGYQSGVNDVIALIKKGEK